MECCLYGSELGKPHPIILLLLKLNNKPPLPYFFNRFFLFKINMLKKRIKGFRREA